MVHSSRVTWQALNERFPALLCMQHRYAALSSARHPAIHQPWPVAYCQKNSVCPSGYKYLLWLQDCQAYIATGAGECDSLLLSCPNKEIKESAVHILGPRVKCLWRYILCYTLRPAEKKIFASINRKHSV